jgi:hypothetical protein
LGRTFRGRLYSSLLLDDELLRAISVGGLTVVSESGHTRETRMVTKSSGERQRRRRNILDGRTRWPRLRRLSRLRRLWPRLRRLRTWLRLRWLRWLRPRLRWLRLRQHRGGLRWAGGGVAAEAEPTGAGAADIGSGVATIDAYSVGSVGTIEAISPLAGPRLYLLLCSRHRMVCRYR